MTSVKAEVSSRPDRTVHPLRFIHVFKGYNVLLYCSHHNPNYINKLFLSPQGDAIPSLPTPSRKKSSSHPSSPGVTSPLRKFPFKSYYWTLIGPDGPYWTFIFRIVHFLILHPSLNLSNAIS